MRRPSRSSDRRSSSWSRRGSLVSLEDVDENSHEMFAGAASEVIPSSISSLHYPHHFTRSRMNSSVSRETSPLLGEELEPIGLARSRSSVGSTDTHGQFSFFSPDEIERAPGGSTLDDPNDPIDYNTDWDGGSRRGSVALEAYPLPSPSPGALAPVDADWADDVGSHDFDRGRHRHRPRADSTYSEPSSDESDSQSSTASGGAAQFHADASTHKQRYYLAEEDIVIGIAGYQSTALHRAAYVAVCALTGGLGFVALRWFPRARVGLMGRRVPLGAADWVVVENEFGELSIESIAVYKFNDRLLKVLPAEKGGAIPVPMAEVSDPVVPVLHLFQYRYVQFFYSPPDDLFRTNTTWVDPHWLSGARGLRLGLPQAVCDQRATVFGANSITIDDKPWTQLLVDEVLHPFYVFQVFSILLWLADDYFYYALCIFIISLVSIISTLVETKSTIKRLKQMAHFSCDVRVWRNGFWKQLELDELVPGDVFEVESSLSSVPCDALVLNGECVVNESMLTGESVPVTKTPVSDDFLPLLSDNFTAPAIARCSLYSGTKLLRAKSSNDDPVLAMVVRTGFNTTKGSLVRSMLFPKPTGFKFYQDSFKYIGFMAIIAAIGFIYSTINFIRLGLPKLLMLLRALDIITIVVPPALPATLTIGTTFAISRLKQKGIFCIAPTRVNVGGKLDVVCFDKTGTLTEDGLDVLGVHWTENAAGRKAMVFADLSDTATHSVERSADSHEVSTQKTLRAAMASCHSLRLLDDELAGDPLDAKMFEFSAAAYADSGNFPVVTTDEDLSIVREVEFVSSLRRMSVVVKSSTESYVFTKGAPEVLAEICRPDSLPENYDELLHHYTRSGYRVIAVGLKTGPVGESRTEIELDLTFCGFVIFENKLKPASAPTLAHLARARIRTVMCTGDNVLTAVSVARECGLVAPEITVYVPQWVDNRLVWEELDDGSSELKSGSTLAARLDPISLVPVSAHLEKPYRIAITGDIFKHILLDINNTTLTRNVLMKCDVYARMSPDEKHELVLQLQKIDYTVGFCGDGANDCGALKAADVGISLSEAEASVAAPFTSRNFDISCVVDVIKEGRSSLVTSFSCFKYMSLYLAIQFVSVSLLYKRGTNLGDFQFLYIDLFLILPLAIFMAWSKPYHKLVIKRPTANLVSPKVLVPLVCHIMILLVFQLAIWLYVQRQPWYARPVPGGDDQVESSDNTVLFLYANLQYILIAVVLSSGKPYREPITKNYPFLVNLVLATLISILLFGVDATSPMGRFMQLTNMSSGTYWLMVVLAAANLAVMMVGDKKWFPALARWFKRLVHGSRPKSKKVFKNLADTGEV